MTNANDARKAHNLLDDLDARAELSQEQEKLLRSFLPELPKQKTLEDVQREVYERWLDVEGDEWDSDNWGTLEEFLGGLQYCLKDLIDAEPAKPTHPEFLETEADYQNAPEGTIAAWEDSLPWHKLNAAWLSTASPVGSDAKSLSNITRRILRWGWGNEQPG